jgi:type VI secretion system protein ImpE
MNATDLFRAGRLQAALDAQLQDVKAHPADHGKRLFLFELAAFSGDLDRARRQLDAVEVHDPETEATKINYRRLLDAEDKRRRLFRDGLQPRLLGETPAHVKLRLEAVQRLRENNVTDASALLQQANDAIPTLKGTLNGAPFEGIRDADDLLGSVLEVMAKGEYFWVPLEHIESIANNPPKTPRDLLWIPARLVTAGGEAEVFLPVLYPGTHDSADEGLKLGRATDWKQEAGGPVLGVGRKEFVVGEEGKSLNEWRELVVE